MYLYTGTHQSLLNVSNFIHTMQKRQSLKVVCFEEIAFDKGFMFRQKLIKQLTPLSKNE